MIDYSVLAASVDHYARFGFQRIEAPWLVSQATSAITRPAMMPDYIVQKSNETKKKVFVASGEQSFLYLINKGHLPEAGRFLTITPCMRAEDFDQTHTKYFMKCELIAYSTRGFSEETKKALIAEVVEHAFSFFVERGMPSDKLERTSIYGVEQVDIEYFDPEIDYTNRVELGSYGFRSHGVIDWVYGTGVAEPRFSSTLALHRRKHGRLSQG